MPKDILLGVFDELGKFFNPPKKSYYQKRKEAYQKQALKRKRGHAKRRSFNQHKKYANKKNISEYSRLMKIKSYKKRSKHEQKSTGNYTNMQTGTDNGQNRPVRRQKSPECTAEFDHGNRHANRGIRSTDA